MSALFYLLGTVAKANARLWRYRVNFLPLNVILVAVMAIAGFAAMDTAVERLENATSPIPLSIGQIHDSQTIPQNYVTVAGVEIPEGVYEFGNKNSKGETNVEKSWSPLVDRANRRVLLVQHAGKAAGGDPHQVSITGMLRELNADLRRTLASDSNSIGGLPVETRYMLVAGDHPANFIVSALLTILCFGGVALFAVATIVRNTVFQRAALGSPLSRVQSKDHITVRVTGTFVLEQAGHTTEKRFNDVPAILAHAANGAPGLYANIDASSRFMGFETSNRVGIWSLMVEPGSVREAQPGFLYWGSRRRVAVRFGYQGPGGRTKRKAIISADDVQRLDAAIAMLTTS
jgi:hypothetical protein